MAPDFGASTIITVDADVAYVNYVRCPRLDTVEVSEYYVLIEWARFLAKRRESDAKSINDSLLAERFFDKYTGRQSVKSGKALTPHSRGTKSYYF